MQAAAHIIASRSYGSSQNGDPANGQIPLSAEEAHTAAIAKGEARLAEGKKQLQKFHQAISGRPSR